MKKIMALCLVMLFAVQPVFAEETEGDKLPAVKAQGAVLMDFDTGRVLWGKNMDTPMAMASTTKIMTAILAIEEGNLEDTVVASKQAALAPKVKMNLSVGEEHTLEDLLYPLMLQSSNDAAVAIAEHVGGSVEAFCARMTEKAEELGAKDTVFETPNGLDAGEHHSTAYDMALIARYALSNEKFVEIINTKEITIPKRGEHSQSYTILNKNRLLNEYEGAFGVKTGFTGKAGQCFVGAAKRDGKTLISVVLASGWGTGGKEQKWRDTKAILDYGFQNFDKTTVISEGEALSERIPVLRSRKESVGLVFDRELSAMLTEKEAAGVTKKLFLAPELSAPVHAGALAGTCKVYLANGELLGEVNVLTTEAAARHDFETSLKKIINYWINGTNIDILVENLI